MAFPADHHRSRARVRSQHVGLMLIRYGLGVILVIAGLVALIVDPGGFGVDGFALAAGAGGSVLMLNWLYRVGVRSDQERLQEEAARVFRAEHGHWPDEPPQQPARRRRTGISSRGGSTS